MSKHDDNTADSLEEVIAQFEIPSDEPFSGYDLFDKILGSESGQSTTGNSMTIPHGEIFEVKVPGRTSSSGYAFDGSVPYSLSA